VIAEAHQAVVANHLVAEAHVAMINPLPYIIMIAVAIFIIAALPKFDGLTILTLALTVGSIVFYWKFFDHAKAAHYQRRWNTK
jgi:hypothetical protein